MRLEDLTVEVRNRDLVRVGMIRHEELDLRVAGLANNVGTWAVRLPAEHPLATALRQPGAGLIVTGPPSARMTKAADGTWVPGSHFGEREVIISGPATNTEREARANDPQGTVVISGVADDVILSDTLAWPEPRNVNPVLQTKSHDVREGAAETVMRAFVSANIGADAPAKRRKAKLTLAPDLGRGGVIKKSARFPVLGNLLEDIAATAGLTFRVVQRGDVLVFEIDEVTDRSSYIRLDVQSGTLASQKVAITSPGVTQVIVAGQGEMVERQFYAATNNIAEAAELAWGRRIERFIDQRQTDDPKEHAAKAKEVLEKEGLTGVSMRLVPTNDLTMRYAIDWFMGDTVSAVIDDDAEVKSTITGFALVADSTGVRCGATLGDPTDFDPLAHVAERLSDVETRISALEREEQTVALSGAVADAQATATQALNRAGTGVTDSADARAIAEAAKARADQAILDAAAAYARAADIEELAEAVQGDVATAQTAADDAAYSAANALQAAYEADIKGVNAQQQADLAASAADAAQEAADAAGTAAAQADADAARAAADAAQAIADALNAKKIADKGVADAAAAQTAANIAKAAADAAKTAADNARTAANQAIADAGDAQATADGAVTTYFQSTAPTGLTAKDVGDLWIKSGDSNKLSRWSGTAWVASEDTRVATALTNAANAATAAGNAQTTANSKIVTLYQSTEPASTGRTTGDLWVHTGMSNRLFRWSGSAWVDAQDGAITAAKAAADAAKTAADSAKTQADLGVARAATAQATADGKVNSYFQSTAPTGLAAKDVGDLWFDSANSNRMSRWSGTAWVVADDQRVAQALTNAANANTAAGNAQTTANSKIVTFYQSGAPATTGRTTGDLWVDTGNGNRLNRWSGTAWVLVQDTAISAAQARADKAVTDAATAASAASTAQSAANTAKTVADTAVTNAATAATAAETARLRAVAMMGDTLQPNGGFEYGALGWGGALNIDTAIKRGGGASLRLDSNGGIRDVIGERIPVTEGLTQKFYAEGWVRSNGYTGAGAIQLGATYTTASGTNGYPQFWGANANSIGTNWVFITGTITLPAEATGFYVRPSIRESVPAGCSIYWDDIVVRRVNPEAEKALADAAAADAKAAAARTQADTAVTNAATAKTAADNAKAAADTAQAAAMSAQVMEAINRNPLFYDWPTGQAYPTGWSPWNATPIKETVFDRTPPFSVRYQTSGTAQAGMTATQGGAFADLPFGVEYVVVEVDFMLVSGALGGSGVIIDWVGTAATSNTDTGYRRVINLATEVPSPSLGKWHRVTKTLRKPTTATGTQTGWQTYLMASWDGHGTCVTKDICFDRFAVRPATVEEVTAFGTPAQITTVTTLANNAQTAANTAQTTANTAVTNAATAQARANTAFTLADGKNRVFVQATAPTGLSSSNAGDLWIDTANGRRLSNWSGSAWVLQQFGTEALAAKSIRAGDVLVDGSVLAAQIHADAINGKTITGAIVRTAASGQRLQMDSTNGLSGYDAAGLLTMRLTGGAAGNMLQGEIRTSSPGRGAYMALNPGGVNPSQIRFYGQDENGSSSGSYASIDIITSQLQVGGGTAGNPTPIYEYAPSLRITIPPGGTSNGADPYATASPLEIYGNLHVKGRITSDSKTGLNYDSGWVNLTLNAPWVHYGAPWPVPQGRRIGDRVILKGLIKSTSTPGYNMVICTLPGVLRSAIAGPGLHLPVASAEAFGSVAVTGPEDNYVMRFKSGNPNLWLDLASISYLVN